MKISLIILSSLLLALGFNSCHTHLQIEKRLYRKGHYISLINKRKSEKPPVHITRADGKKPGPETDHSVRIDPENNRVISLPQPEKTGTGPGIVLENGAPEIREPHHDRLVHVHSNPGEQNFICKPPAGPVMGNLLMQFIFCAIALPFTIRTLRTTPSALSSYGRTFPVQSRFRIAIYHGLIFLSSLGIGSMVNVTAGFSGPEISLGLIASYGLLASIYYPVNAIMKKGKQRIFIKKSLIALGVLFPGLALIFFSQGAVPGEEEYTAGEIAVRIVLMLLLIAVFCASMYGLAGLACNLSCSGYEVLAVIVFFGGGYLASFLFMLGAMHLFKKKLSDEAARAEQRRKILDSSLLAAGLIILGLVLIFLLAM